jgi:WD40 repeat protein
VLHPHAFSRSISFAVNVSVDLLFLSLLFPIVKGRVGHKLVHSLLHSLNFAFPPLLLSLSTQGVSDIAWSSDSKYIASASDDATVRLWEVATVSRDPEIRIVVYNLHFLFQK